MSLKKYGVIDHEGELDYVIKSTNHRGGKLLELWTTEEGQWTPHHRNKKVCSIVDTGNGIKLKAIRPVFDYDNASELQILLSFALHWDLPDQLHTIIEIPEVVTSLAV